MSSHRVIVIDTSIFCCWLDIPHKNTCGSGDDVWDHARVVSYLQGEIDNGAHLVLPLASMIETGNHIAQSNGNRHILASKLADIMQSTINGESPWTAFDRQNELWSKDNLNDLANRWPDQAVHGIGIGDATIIDVANFFALSGTITVKILTGDRGLAAYQPPAPKPLTPRRRR